MVRYHRVKFKVMVSNFIFGVVYARVKALFISGLDELDARRGRCLWSVLASPAGAVRRPVLLYGVAHGGITFLFQAQVPSILAMFLA